MTEAKFDGQTITTQWQYELMNRMVALGYDVDQKGMCHGLATMAIQALLIGDFKSFEERLTRFYNIPIEDLKNASNITNPFLVDYRAFCEGVMLYQTPQAHPELFEANSSPQKQQDNSVLNEILRTPALEKLGGMVEAASFSGIYSLDELTQYFKTLKESFGEEPIALSLSSYGHTICVSYDLSNKENPWLIADANQFPMKRYQNDEEIAKGVMNAFFCNNSIAFSSTICTTKNNNPEQRSSIAKWMDNAMWKELHKPTDKKAQVVDEGGISWLVISARNGQVDAVNKLLLDTSIDPDKENPILRTPLMVAVSSGQVEVINRLLEDPRVDPNRMDKFRNTSLLIAAKAKQPKVIEALLANEKVDPNKVLNEDNQAVLHIAAKEGNVDVVKALLAGERTRHDLKDRHGRNALSYAVEFGNTQVVEQFLAIENTDPNQTVWGESLLHLASKLGYPDMIKLLLAQKNIDYNQSASNGFTALHFAITSGKMEVIKLLLDKKELDPNKATPEGLTPLFFALYQFLATSHNNKEIIKAILARPDIDFDAVGPNGLTVLQEAQKAGNPDLENMIKLAIKMSPGIQNSYLLEPVINLYKLAIQVLDKTGNQGFLKEAFQKSLGKLEDDVNKSDNILHPMDYLDPLRELISGVRRTPTPAFFSGVKISTLDLFKKFEETEIEVFDRFCENNKLNRTGNSPQP